MLYEYNKYSIIRTFHLCSIPWIGNWIFTKEEIMIFRIALQLIQFTRAWTKNVSMKIIIFIVVVVVTLFIIIWLWTSIHQYMIKRWTKYITIWFCTHFIVNTIMPYYFEVVKILIVSGMFRWNCLNYILWFCFTCKAYFRKTTISFSKNQNTN